jgi:hypothetical protein
MEKKKKKKNKKKKNNNNNNKAFDLTFPSQLSICMLMYLNTQNAPSIYRNPASQGCPTRGLLSHL